MCQQSLQQEGASVLHLIILQSIYLRWVINIIHIYFIARCTLWGSFAAIVLQSTTNTLFYYVLFVFIIELCFRHKFRIIPLWYFQTHFLLQTNKSTTYQNIWSCPISKHWMTEPYQESDHCGEGDCDLDINFLASDNLCQYTTVTNQCYHLPCNWTWLLWYCHCWSHFKKRHGRL